MIRNRDGEWDTRGFEITYAICSDCKRPCEIKAIDAGPEGSLWPCWTDVSACCEADLWSEERLANYLKELET